MNKKYKANNALIPKSPRAKSKEHVYIYIDRLFYGSTLKSGRKVFY